MSLKLPVMHNDEEVGTITVSLNMDACTGELLMAINNGRPCSAILTGMFEAPPETVTEAVVEAPAPSDQMDTDLFVAEEIDDAD